MRLKHILLFLLFFVLFFVLGIRVLDPDFGWQLKNGQTFLMTGIFYKDPYSYTMPSYPVVSHEWGSDILIAVIYKLSGFIGLSILFSLLFLVSISLFAYFFSTYAFNKKYINDSLFWNISVFTFSIGIFFNYFYVRPQIFSWILWIPIVMVLIKRKWFDKYRFCLPFLFLIWANLHGGFAIGIIFILLNAIFSTIRTRKIQYKDFLVAVLCLLATFINPFGVNLWREVLATFFSSNLRNYISEWRSIITFGFSFVDFLLLFLISITSVLIWNFRKQINFELIVIYIILLGLGFSSIKNLPFWLIFNLALSPYLFYLLYKKIIKNKISLIRFRKAGLVVFIFSIIFSTLLYYFYITTVKVTFQNYPKDAISYLETNLPKGQIFSQYGWGGYLIWEMPQKKVYIDGRMGVWSWTGNKTGESNNVFDEYNNIFNEKVNFNDVAKKYNIDTVLWPIENDNYKNSAWYKLNKITCRFIWIDSTCNIIKQKLFRQILQQDGWKIIYQDKIAVIYKKI